MIHFAHATINFPAMMGSVRLPIHAMNAPDRAAVALTNEYLLGEVGLKVTGSFINSRWSGCCRVGYIIETFEVATTSWHTPLHVPPSRPPQIMTSKPRSTVIRILLFGLLLFSLIPLWASVHISRIGCHRIKQSKVGEPNKQQQDRIYN